jgi:hypothetical protein
MSAVVGSQYRAMTKAAEILIAQHYSQGKLTKMGKSKNLLRKRNFKKAKMSPLLICGNF